ncbi:Flp pilus assembly protein CpaB [Bacillus sp. RO1]|uniref:Flp pilus assembly protein CpaB n=1 Tax=Bacillus sp. RO1 TaxID=2722703 RepID=UPI00145733CF|nr:Flp pilus assembly protein CpaB [Bacillus sp. RO1]NLP50799.1 Flp pilus assembly protein CpaB [Bacillus sp. RO1]
MTLKKVWLLSIMFGVVSTICFYLFYLPGGPNQKKEPANNVVLAAEEEMEEEVVVTEFEIEAGKRAMSIAVNDVQGVSGHLEPGAMVDIFVNIETTKEDNEEVVPSQVGTFVLQNVKVLAVGHFMDEPETGARYQMITVEATPEQGASLGFASQHSIYLMLRPEGDDSTLKENILMDEKQLIKKGGQ